MKARLGYLLPLFAAAGIGSTAQATDPGAVRGGGNGIIASGPLDHWIPPIVISSTVYNFVTQEAIDQPPDNDFDIQFGFSSIGSLLRFNPNSDYDARVVLDASGGVAALHEGDVVGPDSQFSQPSGFPPLTSPDWRMGRDAYIGMRFNCDGRLPIPVPGTVCYGYIHLATSDPSAYSAVIADAAFDGDGGAITIADPSPVATPLLLAEVSSQSRSALVGESTTFTVTLDNARQAGAATLTADLVNTFPPGVTLAPAPKAATTCLGGRLATTPNSVTLKSGAKIPAAGRCTVAVDVVAQARGTYDVVLAPGALQTDLGDNADDVDVPVLAADNQTLPQMAVLPLPLAGTVTAGASMALPLTIQNIGGTSLNWAFAETTDAARGHFPAQAVLTPAGGKKAALDAFPRPGAAAAAAPARSDAAAVPGYVTIPDFNSPLGFKFAALDVTDPATLETIFQPSELLMGAGFLDVAPNRPSKRQPSAVAASAAPTLYGLSLASSADGSQLGKLVTIDPRTGLSTELPFQWDHQDSGFIMLGGTADPSTQTLYWVWQNTFADEEILSTVDPLTGIATDIGVVSGHVPGIAADQAGHLYGIDSDSDTLVAIDKTTAAVATIGPLGIDANGVPGLAFDPAGGTLYFADPNTLTMYTVDTSSGQASAIGSIPYQLAALAIGGDGIPNCSNPSDVPWLSVSPTSGSTAPSSASQVVVSVSAASLPPGQYHANLCIGSDDFISKTFAVPIRVTVTPSGADPCLVADTVFCDGFDRVVGDARQSPRDTGFEATLSNAGPNPDWLGSDSNSSGATPFYSTALGLAHGGRWAAWGGGWGMAGTQTWSQRVTIRSGGPRWLNYWRFLRDVPAAPATLTISVDGTPASTVDVAGLAADTAWRNVSVDLSAFADNAGHDLRFEYAASGDDGNCFIDDVSIDPAPSPARSP